MICLCKSSAGRPACLPVAGGRRPGARAPKANVRREQYFLAPEGRLKFNVVVFGWRAGITLQAARATSDNICARKRL